MKFSCERLRRWIASLKYDKRVSEVLHSLPNAKVHAELAHCGEKFFAARHSPTTARPHLHRGVVERGQLAPAPWYTVVPVKVHTAVPTHVHAQYSLGTRPPKLPPCN